MGQGNALEIIGLGADGDGMAIENGQTRYFPNTLPGEFVDPLTGNVETPSPQRIEPACRHFGPCGGCALQHLDDARYAAFKTNLLAETLQRLGYTTPLPALARTPPHARRRMDLAIRRENGAVRIGLHMRRSSSVVDMMECPVLDPALFAVVQSLRITLRSLSGLKREGSAIVNLLDSGPDILLRTDAALNAQDRTRLAELATRLGMSRISWAQGLRDIPEPAAALRPATNAFSGFHTPMFPGAFLQASREGEAAIQDAVLAALPARLPARSRIVELFAGCGSITHAIATRARVDAYEGDPAAIQSLRAARNPRVLAHHRDLARQPLQPADIKTAAAIVLDPPYNGAIAQMPALAGSGVPIIYVTCNPAILLRDARVLLGAGYRVTSAVAIDQFLWSPRIEGVVGFSK